MARRKKSDSTPGADAAAVEAPDIADIAAGVPEAPADAAPVVADPADEIPAGPPDKRTRKLAQYRALLKAARADGDAGLVAFYQRRINGLGG